MKKTLLMVFALVASFAVTSLSGCTKDDSSYDSSNYVGTYVGYFSLDSLEISAAALDTVIGKQLIDTLTITENGNMEDNIVIATSKVLNTTIDITLTSETTGSIAINNKSVTITTVSATNVNASGNSVYNTGSNTLDITAVATDGNVFSLPLIRLAKPHLSGHFTKQ